MAKRKYELKRRAEHQEETRRKIVEATVHLHETVGVQGTSISAIASEAGVERLTVYRYFPDERSLLTACTGHYLSLNPPPNPEHWRAIADPDVCLETALTEIYAYHRQTETMMISANRDIEVLPVLRELLTPLFEYWDGVRDLLADEYPRNAETDDLIRAAIGHAIDFTTWRSLVRQRSLEDAEAVRVMVSMIRCLSDC